MHSTNYRKRRPIVKNEEDIFNAVLVDPIADIIKHAADLGFSLGELQDGLEVAFMHAEAELMEVA